MKKLLKKRYFIPLVVVIALAVAGAAYAAWQTSASANAPGATGSTSLGISAGSVPSSWLFYPASGPTSTYACTYFTTHPIGVTNNGNATTPITFSVGIVPSTATLLTSSVDLTAFHIVYSVTGGTAPVTGTQTTTLAALMSSGVTIDTGLAPGATDHVAITTYLDQSAPISYEGLTGTLLYTFTTASFGD